jgi:predicted nucleic acid-binding protein
LLDFCLDGTLQPILTEAIEAENRHILRKVRPPPAFLEKIDALGIRAEWVEPREGIAVCEDPDDDKFIAGALGGGADAIISSDRHLLEQNGYEELRICSAGVFLRGFEKR